MNPNMYDGLRVAVINGPEGLSEIYKLRHDAYVHEGALKPRPDGAFIDRYDLARTSVILGVEEEGAGFVGSIRLGIQPPASQGIADYASAPEFIVFPEELKPLLSDNRPIASGARFSILPGHKRRTAIALMLVLSQVIGAAAAGAKWGIATARGSHLHFYRRLLLMSEICAPRRMPGLEYDYALLAADLDVHFEDSLSMFPEACRVHVAQTSPNLAEQVRATLMSLPQEVAA